MVLKDKNFLSNNYLKKNTKIRYFLSLVLFLYYSCLFKNRIHFLYTEFDFSKQKLIFYNKFIFWKHELTCYHFYHFILTFLYLIFLILNARGGGGRALRVKNVDNFLVHISKFCLWVLHWTFPFQSFAHLTCVT